MIVLAACAFFHVLTFMNPFGRVQSQPFETLPACEQERQATLRVIQRLIDAGVLGAGRTFTLPACELQVVPAPPAGRGHG